MQGRKDWPIKARAGRPCSLTLALYRRAMRRPPGIGPRRPPLVTGRLLILRGRRAPCRRDPSTRRRPGPRSHSRSRAAAAWGMSNGWRGAADALREWPRGHSRATGPKGRQRQGARRPLASSRSPATSAAGPRFQGPPPGMHGTKDGKTTDERSDVGRTWTGAITWPGARLPSV